MIVCLHIESELGEDADEIILLGALLQLLGAGPGVEHFLRLSTAESPATCGRFGRFHETAVEQVLTDRCESLGRNTEIVVDDRVIVTHVSVSFQRRLNPATYRAASAVREAYALSAFI